MASGRPLKFCMVTTFYPPYHFGGDGVFVYRLAEELAARGHRVDVVHSVDAYHLKHPGEPAVAFRHHPNVTRHPLRSRQPLWPALAAQQLGRPGLYGRQLRAVLGGGRYDVIHYHNVSLLGGPGVLRYGDAVKLYTAHEYWLVCPTHVLFAFDREACTARRCLRCTLHARRPPQLWRYTGLMADCTRHVDAFLMPSEFALERHRRDGLDRPLVHLPHFVPQPREAGPAAADSADRPFFLFVGRLEKLKGLQDVIPLFRGHPSADLRVVGTGDYEPALRELAAGSDRVRFLGHVHPDELAGLYRRATAVLVPSLCYETFGLTAAEALASGTPVILRDIGALPEIVAHSGAGFTFRTPDECRAAMDRLLADPALRAELGRKGRAAAGRLWTAEAHVGRYLDIVAESAERRAAGCVQPRSRSLPVVG